MSKLEYCCKCSEATGKAGAGDDSLYTEQDGPFCESCYSLTTPSPANGADPDNMEASYDHSTHDKRMEVLKGLREGANGAEMPKPALRTDMHIDGKGVPAYSADQLRAAVLAERNACADIVDNADSPDCGGWNMNHIAEMIRART